ncbi:MAG: hypothetical protein IPJ65_22575 [Archangiaceae bacterium]|nr:hypothetical protein [Archangiaceae bacterium]
MVREGIGGGKDGFFNPTALNDVLAYVYEPAPADRMPRSFKLATCNVENFFDTAPNAMREKLGDAYRSVEGISQAA